jgi:hypothetical protein
MTGFWPIQVAFLALRGTAPASVRAQWATAENLPPSPDAALGDGVGRSAANSTTLPFFKIQKFNR